MFGKRILNVEVYGDQTIYGIKYFKDSIVVPENSLYCYQIADIGTFITDKNFVTLTTSSLTVVKISQLTVPAGVWLLSSQVALVNTTAVTTTYVPNCQTSITPYSTSLDLDNVVSSRNTNSNTFVQYAWHSQQNTRIVTVNTNTTYYLNMTVQFNNGVTMDYSTSFLTAVRIA